MIILNIIALFCFILVNGREIPSEAEEDFDILSPSELSPAVFRNVETQYNCTSSQMTIQGFDIKMSDVINHDCWTNASDIQIFALNKIFIDCDVIKKGAYLSVYAPTWECIGMRKIIVKGKDGEPHIPSTAQGYGTNGEPGLPGDAGGIFIGVGKNFINATELKIKANGGNGGPGQHGAKGIDGIHGDDFKKEYMHKKADELEIFLNERGFDFFKSIDIGNIFRYSQTGLIQIFEIYGKIATSSGDGGAGGAGGLEGRHGHIYLSGFDSYPIVGIVIGKNGTIGKGGPPGNAAPNGRNVECKYVYGLGVTTLTCKSNETSMGPIGKYGKDGGNEVNKKEPKIPPDFNFDDLMNRFQQFVRLNLVTNGIQTDSTRFIKNV